MQQQVFLTSQHLYNLAEWSLQNFPSLQRVVIVKRIPRYDSEINSHLSEYGNSVLDDIWIRNGCNKKIVIDKQDLECEGFLREQRYGSTRDNNFDGVHMRGYFATQHMTRTFINMLIRIFPHLRPNENVLRPDSNLRDPRLNRVNNHIYQNGGVTSGVTHF